MSLYHWLQTFIIDEVVEKDNAFYAELEDICCELENVVTLYDRIRNYVTRKPYSTQKFKLNFASPTLASGWSRSKEFDNNAIILLRNNKYYIAIFNVNNKPDKQIIKGSEEQRLSTDYKKWYIISCLVLIRCFLRYLLNLIQEKEIITHHHIY